MTDKPARPGARWSITNDPGPYWEIMVEHSRALADIASALQTRCPSCGLGPVLRVREVTQGKSQKYKCLYLECVCGQHMVDGGLVYNDETMLAALRGVGRIWLTNCGGGGQKP